MCDISERKPGYYMIRYAHEKGPWEPSEWDGERWSVIGSDQSFADVTTGEIGPRIPTPDEKGDTVTMPRALYELLYAKRDTIDRHYQRESIPPFTWPPK